MKEYWHVGARNKGGAYGTDYGHGGGADNPIIDIDDGIPEDSGGSVPQDRGFDYSSENYYVNPGTDAGNNPGDSRSRTPDEFNPRSMI